MKALVCRRKRGGYALLMLLVALVVVESAALLIAYAHARAVHLQIDSVRRLRLLALADSAAEVTLARLARDSAEPGLEPTDFGGGTIASAVERVDEWHLRIETRAQLGNLERRVELLVELTAGGPLVVAWHPLAQGPVP